MSERLRPPKVNAKAFIFNSEGEILVLRRSLFNLHRRAAWDLPGGGLKIKKIKLSQPAEGPVAAAFREIHEETGLVIANLSFLEVASRIRESRRGKVEIVSYLYSGLVDEVDPHITLGWEHSESDWASLTEFQTLNISEKYRTAAKSHFGDGLGPSRTPNIDSK